MATCPKGHDSGTDDYCDQCGTPITGAGPATTAAPDPATGSAPTADGADRAAGQACPHCGTPRAGRFCEVDGYDFVAADLGGSPPPESVGGDADGGAASSDAEGGGTGPGTGSGDAATGDVMEPSTNGGPADGSAPDRSAGSGWRITLTADRAYHERVLAFNGPDAATMTFPPFYPQREFVLSGGQMLIGRHSRSRGINPQIDLTGPPEDPGISHSHALLVPGTDDTWSVVDLDSANGTYLNDSTDALTPNNPVTLHDGDRVHLGAWTTLTVTNTP